MTKETRRTWSSSTKNEGTYERLATHLTATVVTERFAHPGVEEVVRYDVSSLLAFNFVLEGAL